MHFSPKTIGLSFFIVLGLLVGFVTHLPDNRLHIIVCDVGQGDGMYIRTPDGNDVVIDGGPNSKIVECLGRHMPFWDHTIEMVAMTHPQADHMTGLSMIIDRYSVLYFVTSPVGNTTDGFKQLKQLITDKHIPVKNPYTGTNITFGEAIFKTLWPDKNWLFSTADSQLLTANSSVLGAFTTTQDLNDFSLYFHLQYGDFDALFTGDGDIKMQTELMKRITLPDIEVLKVPHHGSKTGMSGEFLDALKPELALISVGAKNRYGHPTQQALDLLSARGIKTLRTDQRGDIEVVSDGTSWWVK